MLFNYCPKVILTRTMLYHGLHFMLQNKFMSKNSNFLSTLLPLFPEKAASLSMVKHDMGVIKSVTDYLNPEQVPVMAIDQP